MNKKLMKKETKKEKRMKEKTLQVKTGDSFSLGLVYFGYEGIWKSNF